MGAPVMIGAIRHFECPALSRMLIAGSAWGSVLSAGLLAIAWQQCGMPCPLDVALTATASVSVGILTIGPIVAFTRS
jgi:hypothetical protein